jgi:hypothetical protein
MATKMTKSTIVKSSKPTTTSAPKVSRARKSDTVTISPAPDVIAVRAYERFVERGYQHGHDLEDWLLAERDLTQPA